MCCLFCLKDRAAETELGLLFCRELELYSPEFQVNSRYITMTSSVHLQSLNLIFGLSPVLISFYTYFSCVSTVESFLTPRKQN